LAVGGWILPAEAQTTIYDGIIPVKIQRLRQVVDSVQISMEFDFSNLSLATDRYISLTPALVGSQGREVKLKNIQINGQQQHKAFLREVQLNGWQRQIANAHYAVLGLNEAKQNTFRYITSIRYEGWMREAQMNIITDLCGCNGEAQQLARERVANRIVLEGAEPYRALANVAYIRPEAEAVKARSESNDVFLDFPVSQTDINPNFGNNPRELAKIESIIRDIRSDANVRVTGVSITGYASPEGEVNFNNQLSHGRAEALRNYLASRSGIPAQQYRVGNGGEDWEGLARMIQNINNFGPKEAILSIIRSYTPVERKDRLKALDSGRL
jgi:outer membrane protein OmpA-like peptidoglycan-associated protein